MSIQQSIHTIQSTLPATAQLVVVSKTFPESDIEQAYATGVRDFAENKVQELTRKYENLPKDIRWHFIGHLQTNKIKYIASFVHLIHGVDSLKLLTAINKEAAKYNRIIPCLLQFHIAQEETKFGLTLSEAEELLQSEDYKNL
ncbi:MAG: YggS family pyridoxal phosphate-dependent enzyme, partial [Bacteroidales bacterium]|nr:YggS family pyridoxal phosphate-dependent enzyme [Bacteroidales bacterium]